MVVDSAFWRGRRVLVTGHTGFKGTWTCLLLRSAGADVHGYALPPEGLDPLFSVTKIENDIDHRIGNVGDFERVCDAVVEIQPDIIVHMAAQALVKRSYAQPVDTYSTNVMGTVHILEAARLVASVRGVVVVTSDKCYDNVGVDRGFRENDRLGGHDPYSNSKGCAELVVDAYRRSFFQDTSACQVATGRAGNVIGGGDWSPNRLLPDAIRAFSRGKSLQIRNPAAVRPWQHVLDPVIAYLNLAERIVTEPGRYAEGWNFGPAAESELSVGEIADKVAQLWGDQARWELDEGPHAHEAAYLTLDCSKAISRLGWKPLLSLDEALRATMDWYREFERGADMRQFTLGQIRTVLEKVTA